jgi:LCP family protein required for cell wall assembly
VIRRGAALLTLLSVLVTCFQLAGPSRSAHEVEASPVIAGPVHQSFQPTKGKVFVLVIGNDARAGNPDRARADALHVIGLNTKTMRGGILNFPRDSWVNIPGQGMGRINEALYRGGPALMARTVESLTGIRLDLWVMTGFEGFKSIITDLGGVKIHLYRDIFDPAGSGARLRKGTRVLRAVPALAYVRTRKVFALGDVARSTNQARFLLLLLAKLRKQVERNPAALFDWIDVARSHTRSDISAEDMFRLGVLATQVSRKRVGNVTVPVSVGSVGAASVVFISPRASSIYARFRRSAAL